MPLFSYHNVANDAQNHNRDAQHHRRVANVRRYLRHAHVVGRAAAGVPLMLVAGRRRCGAGWIQWRNGRGDDCGSAGGQRILRRIRRTIDGVRIRELGGGCGYDGRREVDEGRGDHCEGVTIGRNHRRISNDIRPASDERKPAGVYTGHIFL